MPRAAKTAGVLALLLAAVPLRPQSDPSPDADDRLRLVQERRTALEKKLRKLRGQERSLLGEVQQLELEVRLRSEKLDETRLLLRRTNSAMDAIQERIRVLEGSIETVRPLLAARGRALYKLGELSYVRLLLSVERPSDFFRGYRFVTTLARRDHDRMSMLRSNLKELTDKRVELEQRTAEAQELRRSLVQTRRRLDADRRHKSGRLRAIVEQKELHAAYVAELREAEVQLGRLLAGLADGVANVPVAAFRGSLPWPVEGRVRLRFGRQKHPRFDTYTVQNGLEIATRSGAPVSAVHEGRVVFADYFRGYGLMLILDHGKKHHSLYAHLADVQVEVGQRVASGQVLGSAGSLGLEGAGLYLEMRFQGKPEDPETWLRKRD